MNMTWQEYCDKIYGCFTGKCVAGTIGAPYEGYKGKLRINYDPSSFSQQISNDDLDLQILWLEVIEKYGSNFTSSDLAKAFYEKCPYAPGEYATFKKNYELGLRPPLTGKFNNNYYIEGMGCPIRSEIWACFAPGNPTLATQLAAKDGVLDHYGESIIAQQYLAAIEALAFINDTKTPDALIILALKYIDANSKFARLVNDVLAWCSESKEPEYVFGRILRDYGHPDCTNMYQNMGIILLALILGKGHFIHSVMMALNCGFDTDCTCATVGAVIGLLDGGKSLMKKYNIPDQSFKCGVDVSRISNRVYDLACDIALAGLFFRDINKKVTITDYSEEHIPTIENIKALPIELNIEYENDNPVIAPGETKKVSICFDSVMKIKASGSIKIYAPEGFTVHPEEKKFRIGGIFSQSPDFYITASKDMPVLMEKNIFKILVTMDNNDCYRYSFGLVGAIIGKVYGPFWENTTRMNPPGNDESYYNNFGRSRNESEAMTKMREFHLNMEADWEQDYLEDQLLGDCLLPPGLVSDPAYRGFNVVLRRDKFCFEDFMSNKMPCVIYFVRDIYAPEDLDICLQIGHSDAFRLWKDGDLIAFSDKSCNWTPENIHLLGVKLNKGTNRFVAKIARTNGVSDFSLMFTKDGACTDMITCLGNCKQ